MTAQDKLARFNTILDHLSQINVQTAQIGFVPNSIRTVHEIYEALVLREIKELEIV